MSFADQVIDWVLRHGRPGAAPEDHELVLLVEHESLADPSPSATLSGQVWRIRKVTGELTLRDALLDAGRLVAIVPTSFVVPLDLAGRAWLGRQVHVRPRDLVAALAQRPCEPISDEQVAEAVVASFQQLRGKPGGWSVAGTVTLREVRNVLLGLQLGGDHRFDRETADALLARWLVEGPPEVTSPRLLEEALRQEHGKVGEWLAWAVTDGDLPGLVAAGALAGSEEGVRAAPELAQNLGAADRHRLRSLVEQSVRAAWQINARRVQAQLAEAERRAQPLLAESAPVHPLLERLLVRHLTAAAKSAAAGTPEDDAKLEALVTHLHREAHTGGLKLVRELSRLARFQRTVDVPASPDLQAWATLARDHIAWADLAFRRARHLLGDVGVQLAEPARVVLNQYASHRNTLNRAFGAWLAQHWGDVAAQTDVRRPFALQHLTRLLVKPLLDQGQRVLLLVLDGCDLASFVDLFGPAARQNGLALGVPELPDPDVRHDLAQGGAWRVAVSPVPTVTSHARRALFAGDLPQSAVLDATEERAANASNDQRAFRENAALGDASRTLLLKGDVGDLGESVRTALASSHQLVAVVLNDLDDALSSKETTPMRPWRVEQLAAEAARWMEAAAEAGWTLVVTADHGHTPYVSRDRKVSVAGAGGRIASEPAPGVIELRDGPLPTAPLHLLADFGAWRGTQHRGWHGGVGLEEVFVPLAVVTRGRAHTEAFAPPEWWRWLAPEDAEAEVAQAASSEAAPEVPGSEPTDAPEPAETLPGDVAVALQYVPDALKLAALLEADGTVDLTMVSVRLGTTISGVRQLVGTANVLLGGANVGRCLVVTGDHIAWGVPAPEPAPAPAPVEESWLDQVQDATERTVLQHLDRHGAITQRELDDLVGSARKARRFAGRVEALSAVAPFRILVEPLPDGTKRYSTLKD